MSSEDTTKEYLKQLLKDNLSIELSEESSPLYDWTEVRILFDGEVIAVAQGPAKQFD